MSRSQARPAVVPQSLARVRRQLTAWYVGTFFAILTLLGVGMFATITRRFDTDLDASLREAAHELVRAASDRRDLAAATPADIMRILRIPERTLYIASPSGASLTSTPVAPWLVPLIHRAAAAGGAAATHGDRAESRILRAYAERFTPATGRPAVAVAVADEVELEDKYTSLIIAFGAAALASLVLIAAGGWMLARKSTAPVEQAIGHMRRFMADAAHELRTPLTAMRSRAEIALTRPREPREYAEALRGIERETVHLARIVDDLLILARADAGERPIQRQRVFLDDITLDVAEAARPLAERKCVRLEVDEFEEAPVNGDPALLRELAMILVDNAVKYTPANGTVHVGVRCDASLAVLTVSDTGVGIPPEHLPHVFERFYRGDASRTRDTVSDGVGLGLSIAQWIAEEHGGSIRLESQPGRGTRAVVQLPAAHAHEQGASVSSS